MQIECSGDFGSLDHSSTLAESDEIRCAGVLLRGWSFPTAEDSLKEGFPSPLAFLALRRRCETKAFVASLDGKRLQFRSRRLDVDGQESAATIGLCDVPGAGLLFGRPPVFKEPLVVVVGAWMLGGATPSLVGFLILASVDLAQKLCRDPLLGIVVKNDIT